MRHLRYTYLLIRTLLSECRWCVLKVIHDFLKSVDVTFLALQKADSHVSQQLHNISVLSDVLINLSGAIVDENVKEPENVARVIGPNAIKMNPFTVDAAASKQHLCSADLWVLELVEGFSNDDTLSVLRTIAVLYLTALNGLMRIKVERNCYDQQFETLPEYTPLDLIGISALDFIQVVRNHKKRILLSFGYTEVSNIIDEHKELAKTVAKEPSLKAALEAGARKPFNEAWKPAGHRFQYLCRFAAGMASLMATTSRVEADFSFINYRKDEYNSALSDYSLEGVLYARQLKELEALVNILHS